MHTRHRLSALIGLLMGTSTVVAAAHVRLEFPIPRYPIPALEDGSNLKQAPCGTAGDHRTTDPSRVSTFRPGEAITVRFKETIDHPGHYRIAFDDDGQDAFVEPASFTDIQAAPSCPFCRRNRRQSRRRIQVNITLPNVECTNCTLQLIQVMTDKPPYVVNTDDVYHQCADIVLSSGATTTRRDELGRRRWRCRRATDAGCSCRAGHLGGGVWSAVGLACIGLLLQRQATDPVALGASTPGVHSDGVFHRRIPSARPWPSPSHGQCRARSLLTHEFPETGVAHRAANGTMSFSHPLDEIARLVRRRAGTTGRA
jgi:hypothetical protein